MMSKYVTANLNPLLYPIDLDIIVQYLRNNYSLWAIEDALLISSPYFPNWDFSDWEQFDNLTGVPL